MIKTILFQSVVVNAWSTHRQLQAFSASKTFSYTGAAQTFTVPSGVHSLTIDAYGSQGVTYDAFGYGGKGGYIQAVVSVTPGQTLYVYVGGQFGLNGGGAGGNGNNLGSGGQGGDGTDIRTSLNDISTRLVVAGGGGGGAYASCTFYAGPTYSSGGDGGGPTGANGIINNCGFGGFTVCTGGSQSSGGLGSNDVFYQGANGGFGFGGNAGGGGGGGEEAFMEEAEALLRVVLVDRVGHLERYS